MMRAANSESVCKSAKKRTHDAFEERPKIDWRLPIVVVGIGEDGTESLFAKTDGALSDGETALLDKFTLSYADGDNFESGMLGLCMLRSIAVRDENYWRENSAESSSVFGAAFRPDTIDGWRKITPREYALLLCGKTLPIALFHRDWD